MNVRFFMPDSTKHARSVLQFGEKVQINSGCKTSRNVTPNVCFVCGKSHEIWIQLWFQSNVETDTHVFFINKSMPAAFFGLCHRTCCRWGFITPACFLCQRLRTTDDIWSCCPKPVGRTDITPIKTRYLRSLERASVVLSKAAWSHDPQNNLSASSEPEQSQGGYPKRYLGSSTPHKVSQRFR